MLASADCASNWIIATVAGDEHDERREERDEQRVLAAVLDDVVESALPVLAAQQPGDPGEPAEPGEAERGR
jgi:hypothetical protein